MDNHVKIFLQFSIVNCCISSSVKPLVLAVEEIHAEYSRGRFHPVYMTSSVFWLCQETEEAARYSLRLQDVVYILILPGHRGI